VPLQRGGGQPVSRPLNAGPAFAWAAQIDPAQAKKLAARIFESYFVQCLDISQDQILRTCLDDCDLSWAAFASARAQGLPAELLRRQVDESIRCGVFGSPFFIVDGEPFFGVEKLPVVEDWLATGGW
jgi:2-hydroxychromene-2-carboxylate isomerase